MLNTGNRTNSTTDAIGKPLTRTTSNVETGAAVQGVPSQAMPSMFVPPIQSALESMPSDVKNMIFAHAAHPVEYQDGLLALAKTSTTMRSTVMEFMRNDENGKRFSTLLKCGPPSLWKAKAKKLNGNANIYRKDFIASSASVFNNVAMKLTGDMANGALTRFKAIEINLNKFYFSKEDCEQIIQNIMGQLGSIQNKPVKINASGFEGERHTLEMILQVALAAIDVSCPVMLDLSNNQMEDADLLPLLEFIKTKPIIYQLNLDQNPLCTGNQPSLALPELFQIMTPLSHLYLRKTGFNDATALLVHEALAKHPCLVALDLRSNALAEAGALPLIKAVGFEKQDGEIHANTTLQALRLQNNHFGNGKNLAAASTHAEFIWRQAMLARPDFSGEVYPEVVQLEEFTIYSASYFDVDVLKNQHIANQAAENQRL